VKLERKLNELLKLCDSAPVNMDALQSLMHQHLGYSLSGADKEPEWPYEEFFAYEMLDYEARLILHNLCLGFDDSTGESRVYLSPGYTSNEIRILF
jgi:hypothetical protein